MNVRNLGQWNKSWVWLRITTWKPQACGLCSQKLWDMKKLQTHTNNTHWVRLVPMFEGKGAMLPPPEHSSCLGMPFSHAAFKVQLGSCGQWRLLIATTGFLRLQNRHPTGSTKSIFLLLIHTNTCKSPPQSKANSHSSASNRVVFVARLSGCVSALHHISRDGERKGGSSNFPLGCKAAHHWSARLVVPGVWDNGSFCALSSGY